MRGAERPVAEPLRVQRGQTAEHSVRPAGPLAHLTAHRDAYFTAVSGQDVQRLTAAWQKRADPGGVERRRPTAGDPVPDRPWPLSEVIFGRVLRSDRHVHHSSTYLAH
ncbi:hypothetical protein GCM10022267_84920 [Lentzea roselyniae]|uniref:Uncharacterized protein n=1 Tax=Lentzea roselyniae TaxID=531940 RepID=A0ABP7CF07_9PSEU